MFYHDMIWAASSEFGTYRLCEQRRFRRACASAQSRQNLRCLFIQAVSQEEPSDRKPDPWPLWMAGHAQLKFVMTECSKTQIRLTGLTWFIPLFRCYRYKVVKEARVCDQYRRHYESLKYHQTLGLKTFTGTPMLHNWAATWQNQKRVCAQRRIRSAWASTQSDQSLRCLHEESLGP